MFTASALWILLLWIEVKHVCIICGSCITNVQCYISFLGILASTDGSNWRPPTPNSGGTCLSVPPCFTPPPVAGVSGGEAPKRSAIFATMRVKFEAFIIEDLRACGVQGWFSCVGLVRFAPEIKINTTLESLEISNSSILLQWEFSVLC